MRKSTHTNPTEVDKQASTSVILQAKPGKENFANCDGTYLFNGDMINGRPVYINLSKERFIAWNGGAWTLTGMQWYQDILSHSSGKDNFSFSGFHFSDNTYYLSESQWEAYTVH